jgi:putative peptide zinc metalloprotease protein
MSIGTETTLLVRPLSVVRQGADYLVGDPERGGYVALPEIGVTVLEWLRAGRTIGEATADATALAGEDVDVADFAEVLCARGFAEPGTPAGPSPDTAPQPSRWATALFGPAGWAVFALAALASIAIYATRPALFPHGTDVFFLPSPVRSIVAATITMLLLGFAHESCHWLAARAEGVPATITVSRRLYLLVLETDLTRLWSIPRRRRYAPLMVGIALDLFLLLAAQLLLLTGRGPTGTLMALSYLQIAVLVPQFFVFMRTDMYAVLATATGCLNLWRVTHLLLRTRLGLGTAAHRAELAAAGPRDHSVARWFSWIYVAGMIAATWFFVVYFLPATIHLISWLAHSLAAADIGHSAFWEALAFGAVVLSSRLLTVYVIIRDLIRKLRGK